MITRLWRGWTSRANAGAYEQFLLMELFPSMRGIPGFRSAEVLRRDDRAQHLPAHPSLPDHRGAHARIDGSRATNRRSGAKFSPRSAFCRSSRLPYR